MEKEQTYQIEVEKEEIKKNIPKNVFNFFIKHLKFLIIPASTLEELTVKETEYENGYKMTILSHNTKLGAGKGAVLNAEFWYAHTLSQKQKKSQREKSL